MPWRIENGQPVRIRPEVKVTVSPQEVTTTIEVATDVFVCPECGKEYKTETGLDNHVDDKH
jgi:hypothetical protein